MVSSDAAWRDCFDRALKSWWLTQGHLNTTAICVFEKRCNVEGLETQEMCQCRRCCLSLQMPSPGVYSSGRNVSECQHIVSGPSFTFTAEKQVMVRRIGVTVTNAYTEK